MDKNFKEYSQSTLTKQLCMVSNARFCVKTTALYGAIMGTTRWCSAMDMGNQCQYTSFPDHDRIYRACIFTCDTDACNSAYSFLSQPPGSLLTSLGDAERASEGGVACGFIRSLGGLRLVALTSSTEDRVRKPVGAGTP
ncbi:unnamed protein product [Dibothriocephalus latus]|uniref:Protein quiver n=1 Tax=Dibothriocephalus latus TaxID=60516 RepID=A0A3P7MUK4_DIBLA|nr:unnamed protein product [Dibothriocephalus latus]